ncbi:MAG: His-Xaa-Ser system radical SAM maturase HxsC [Allorhizobium sp.]
MIDLRLKTEPLPIVEPLIIRLQDSTAECEYDAVLIGKTEERREYDFNGFSVVIHVEKEADLQGDVLLMLPGKSVAHRLVRAKSKHNTFLVTEQCDQLCVMCSQPPKKYHSDIFDQLAIAATLAPNGAYIGISGGEPLLHKERLFQLLRRVIAKRPDLRFHILSNGQHFEPEDTSFLQEHGPDRVLWGIPLYAAEPELHDQIVGKAGAFARLQTNFAMLAETGASIELRTIVLKQNWSSLPDLADYISTRLPFISTWALMQLESIGYGRMNWNISFQDTSVDFRNLGTAANIALAHGLNVSFFNFPLCTVPFNYRQYAPSTISDWKRKYLPQCDRCEIQSTCGGFFEWYAAEKGFERVGAP